LHVIVGAAHSLVKDDDFAVTVPPTAQLRHGQIGLGRQVGCAAVEKDQRGGCRRASVNAVASRDAVSGRCYLPGVPAGWHNFDHTAHVGQGGGLADDDA
jgi:hypothetical protein